MCVCVRARVCVYMCVCVCVCVCDSPHEVDIVVHSGVEQSLGNQKQLVVVLQQLSDPSLRPLDLQHHLTAEHTTGTHLKSYPS